MKTMEKIGLLVLALTLVFAGVMTPGELLNNPDENLALIMKDGQIYKDFR